MREVSSWLGNGLLRGSSGRNRSRSDRYARGSQDYPDNHRPPKPLELFVAQFRFGLIHFCSLIIGQNQLDQTCRGIECTEMLFSVTSLRQKSEARTLRARGHALNKHIIRQRPLSMNAFEATEGPNLWFSQCPPCLRREF